MDDVTANLKTCFEETKDPGDFYFPNPERLQFVCPCGCDAFLGVQFGQGGWNWNGNKEKPTVTPSIRHLGGCKWHGYLTDGVFTSCSDSGT